MNNDNIGLFIFAGVAIAYTLAQIIFVVLPQMAELRPVSKITRFPLKNRFIFWMRSLINHS